MRFKYTRDHSQGRVLDDYFYCKDRVAVITGPLGSGKTFTSCEKLFDVMCSQTPNTERVRKTRIYAVRNTYPDLLGTTVKDWMDLFGDLGRYKGGGIEPPSHKLRFKLPDRTVVSGELIFLALDRPQAIKKLRGAQATCFWLNEIKELPKPVLDMCDLRHGRYPSPMDGGPSWHGIIGDTNQVDQDHYLYELAEVQKPKGWRFFTQPGGVIKLIPGGPWVVNPNAENILNLPDDYYEAGMEGKDNEWIKVNLGNEYGSVSDGQAVYKEQWNDILHVNSDISYIPGEPIAVGLDFGLTPAAIFGQQTARGTVNVLAELTSDGMGIRQFYSLVVRPFVLKHFPGAKITWIGDPAGDKRAETDEQTVFKELDDLGITVEAANTNDPTMRIEAVRYYLHLMAGLRPAFQLHPRCSVLRKGFNGGYKFRRIQVIGDERYMSVPDKNKFSHPHDALQYLMMYYKGDTGSSKPFVRKKVTTRWAN